MLKMIKKIFYCLFVQNYGKTTTYTQNFSGIIFIFMVYSLEHLLFVRRPADNSRVNVRKKK